MIITFYNTIDNANVINKTLHEKKSLSISLLDNQNIDTIKLRIKNLTINEIEENKINYAHIDTFKRYYFIKTINANFGSLIELELTCDYLYTYRAQIKNALGFIRASSNNNFGSINYIESNNKEIMAYTGNNVFNSTSKILICAGG